MSLEMYRKQIDEIDNRILELLGQRRELAINIGNYKRANGIGIYAPEREKQVIASKENLAEKNNLNKQFVRKIFTEIIEYCRKEQL